MLLGLLRNVGAGLVSLGGAVFWTKAMTRLSQTGLIPSRTARKIAHVTTAPFFMFTWPLYSTSFYARLIAAAVPLSFGARIALNPRQNSLATATTRLTATSPKAVADEANSLACYAIAVASLTALGWRTSIPVYIAAAALCFGDGAADIVGTALKGPRLPLPPAVFPRRKTLPGTLAFIAATVGGATGLLRFANVLGYAPDVVPMGVLWKVAVASAAVELVPVEDNITVPATAWMVARTLLHEQ